MIEKETVQLHASEVELKYRSRIPKSKWIQIKNSMDAFRILWEHWNKDTIEHHEEFKALLLNNKNEVLGIAGISVGGVTATIIDPRIIFQYALKAHAVGLIVAHNHPSCNPKPSESDIEITNKLIQAGSVLNIQLLDHIILSGDGSYYSLGDEGRM